MNEKRLAVIYLEECELINLLNWRLAPLGSFVTISVVDYPENMRVERIFFAPERRALGFVVQHDSFDPVSECRELPVLGNTGRIVMHKPTAEESDESSVDYFQRMMGN